MTHDVRKKGQPTGPWATAAQSPKGEFGVAIGCCQLQHGFVPEDRIEAFIAAARKVGEPEYLAMFAAAAEALPRLKNTVRQIVKAASN